MKKESKKNKSIEKKDKQISKQVFNEARKDKPAFLKAMKKIIFSGIFQLILRLFLGITFISASLDKITHPRLFAEVIYNYQILPSTLVNLAAAVMPLLEFVAGITIIAGFWTRASSFILSGLTMIFIAAISFNLIRGLEVNCGCFDVISGSKIGIDLLIRDLLLLIAGIIIIFETSPRLGLDWILSRNK